MIIFTEKHALKVYLSTLKAQGKTIGFVPTMGALHQGHLSLIKQAQQKNDVVVVSIFVNDTKLLKGISCDVLFHPSVEEIYQENVVSENFDFDGLEHQMEGKFRDGHFNGVGTIVKTLFEIVEPDKAYFGQKDFQQFQIIKKMVEKHQLNLKIKGCKIFREKDGLAMSSRNTRLTKEYREIAPFIYKTLKKAKKKFTTENVEKVNEWEENQFKKEPLLELEYFTIADENTLETINKKESGKKYRAFIAVFAGEIRLIDNIQLKN